MPVAVSVAPSESRLWPERPAQPRPPAVVMVVILVRRVVVSRLALHRPEEARHCYDARGEAVYRFRFPLHLVMLVDAPLIDSNQACQSYRRCLWPWHAPPERVPARPRRQYSLRFADESWRQR